MRTIAVMLALALCFASAGARPSTYCKLNDNEYQISRSEAQERMILQKRALIAYSNLMHSFDAEKTGIPVYPEEYGGAYIEGSFLYIYIVGLRDQVKEKYEERCEDSSILKFINAKYSMNYLHSFDEVFNGLLDEYKINTFGVDERNNKYYVGVSPACYESFINDERVDMSIVKVEKTEDAQVCANLYGGDQVTRNGGVYSACIGGTYQGYNAFLTAGHHNENYPTFYRTGAAIGQVWYQRCNNDYGNTGTSSYGDFAIVVMNSNYSPTNKARNQTSLISITDVYSFVPVGTTIYKYGSVSGYSWGTVQAVNQTVVYQSGAYVVRGIVSSYMQNSTATDAILEGDSGGSVYVYDSGSYKLQGNVSGRLVPAAGQIAHTMYSSPIIYATSAGFTPKTN